MLTTDFFQREHIQAGKDVETMAAETGFSRKLLIHYARQCGVTLVGAYRRRTRVRNVPARRRAQIDSDWMLSAAVRGEDWVGALRR